MYRADFPAMLNTNDLPSEPIVPCSGFPFFPVAGAPITFEGVNVRDLSDTLYAMPSIIVAGVVMHLAEH